MSHVLESTGHLEALHPQVDYRQELNPAQYQAVTTLDGPVLVIAGAGSGKTRTLVYRLAYLVDQGIAPWSILLLTFTRKSASEMLNRAAHLLQRPLSQVMGGTFHSVCYHWLLKYGESLGYQGFTVMDRGDQSDLLQMVKDRLGVKKMAGPFPRKDTMADIFSAAVNKNLGLDEVLRRDYPQFAQHHQILSQISGAYWQEKRQRQVLDYDDLLLEGKRLLTEHEELRQRLSERYRYIMVDEYQDTNHLQAELVRLLAYTHNNVMAVGDDCQSIYSFRGADFRNIMDFPQLFPGTHIVKLEENYRSTQPVLDLANAVIAEAREKYTKCLFCIKKGGVKPQLVKTGTENEQSHLVVSQVQEWQRQGMPLRQIAVLFRAAYHSFDLEIELARAGVRFMKFGGFKFMESAHIKDLLSYLRVVANPRDTLSWQRLLTLVPGVGRQTAGKLTAGAADSAGFSGVVEKMAQHRQAGLKNLAETLARLQDPAQTIISRLSQALDHYEPLMQNRFDDFPRRQRDLEHLLTITSRYDDLRGFLNDFTLDPPASLADITNPVHEYLSLSTIHSAKGLEWEAVIIIWAAEGRFPSFYSFEKEAEEEEERRLMYVAVTRAKSQLTIIYPSLGYSRQFGMQYNSPSRFVAQVPRRVLERWKADPYD